MSALILPFKGVWPRIAASAFVAPGAVVIGDVEIGEQSSVWFGCIIRGDVNVVRIGRRSNIQDGSIIHVSSRGQGTHVGDGVLVAHMCLIHDCTLEEGAFVGNGTHVLDGASVGKGAMLAAGSLLTPGKAVPPGALWAGRPARHWRDLSAEDIARNAEVSSRYVDYAAQYLSEGIGAPQAAGSAGAA